MNVLFVPSAWYWLADDGRVFSGPLEATVDASDNGYTDWTAIGNVPTPWPRDNAGNQQTDAAMQDVLTPFGMFVNLKYYTANARYLHRSAGIKITSLSSALFMSDAASVNDVNASYDYALVNAGATFSWKMADGSFTALDKTKITTLHNDILNYVQSCYACESSTVNSITGGSITTRAQVDTAFAAIANTFP
jgi:hypothetical protein